MKIVRWVLVVLMVMLAGCSKPAPKVKLIADSMACNFVEVKKGECLNISPAPGKTTIRCYDGQPDNPDQYGMSPFSFSDPATGKKLTMGGDTFEIDGMKLLIVLDHSGDSAIYLADGSEHSSKACDEAQQKKTEATVAGLGWPVD